MLASSDASPGPAGRAAGRDRLARRAATRPRCCTSRRSLPTPPSGRHQRSRGCWPPPASKARLPWAPDSPVAPRAAALEAFAPSARRVRAVQRADAARGLTPAALRGLAADAAAGACRVRGPERAGADPLRPRRSAHAAGGRPPHRARSTRTRSCSPCPASATRCCAATPPAARVAGLVAFLRGADRRAVLGARRALVAAPVRAGDDRRAAPDAAPRPPRPHVQRDHASRSPASGSTPPRTGARRSGFPGCAPATCGPREPRSSCTTSSGSAACSVSGRLDARGRGTRHRRRPDAAPGTVTYARRRRQRDARRARLHALKSLRLERAGALGVLVHVARPVGDDPAVLVAVPGVAARPGRAGEARLQSRGRRRPRRRRVTSTRAELQRLADVGGLRLHVEDDRAAARCSCSARTSGTATGSRGR